MWFLSPSGWPTHADSADEEWDLADRGYTVIDESDVQAAIDAFHAGLPPVLDDVVTVQELQTPSSPASVALRAAFDAWAVGGYVAELSGGDVYTTNVSTGQRGRITDGLTITAGPIVMGDAVVFTSTEAGQQWAPASGGDPRSTAATPVLAGWGSSSISGLASRLSAKAADAGMTFYNGGIGGEIAETILARYGSRPLLINAVTIPASGPVTVTCSNLQTPFYTTFTFTGSLAGVPGTITRPAGSSATITFTRTTDGAATPVPAGTPLIPAKGQEHRNAVVLLQSADNNLSGVVANSTTDVDQILDWTQDAIDYAGTLGRMVLVLGYWVDSDVPDGDPAHTLIPSHNAKGTARFGQRFLDLGEYVTSAQVWADTGITPTADDLAHQARGVKPPSLSADSQHLNAAGYGAVADLIAERLADLGWMVPTGAGSPVIADTFTRADSTSLGTTETGGLTWQTDGAGWAIASNKLSAAGITANRRARVDASRADYRVKATLATIGGTAATSGGGILVRDNGGGEYIWLSTRITGATAGVQFWRQLTGGSAQIGTSTAIQPQAGDVFEVEAIGSELVAYRNGTEVARATETTNQATGTRVGFLGHTAGTGTSWDNFEVYAA